jgi:hypothetical protein
MLLGTSDRAEGWTERLCIGEHHAEFGYMVGCRLPHFRCDDEAKADGGFEAHFTLRAVDARDEAVTSKISSAGALMVAQADFAKVNCSFPDLLRRWLRLEFLS